MAEVILYYETGIQGVAQLNPEFSKLDEIENNLSFTNSTVGLEPHGIHEMKRERGVPMQFMILKK